MFWLGSGVSVPSSARSNSMKTRFQTSRKRSHSQPGAQSGRSQPCSPPAVEVELGARPARPGRPCLPEVLRARQPHDALRRDADPLPRGDGDLVLAEGELGIAREDRRPEAVAIELHVLGDELPGEVDGAVLEVLAEREVAEHLEERQVPRRQADVVDVGRAEALLHRRQEPRGRLLVPEEVGLRAAASPRSSGGPTGRRSPGRARPRAGGDGPSTRRRRGSPRAARRTCARPRF